MKSLHLFGIISTLSFCAISPAQAAGRTYKLGDVDTFKFTQSMFRSGLTIRTRGLLTQKVLKVYDTGDADIETSTSNVLYKLEGTAKSANMPANMLNREMPALEQTRFTTRFTPKGKMSGDGPSNDLVASITESALLGVLSGGPLKPGKVFSVTLNDATSVNKGTCKVLAVRGEWVTCAIVLNAGADIQLRVTSTASTKSFKIQSASGRLTGLNVERAKDAFDKIEFTMRRI